MQTGQAINKAYNNIQEANEKIFIPPHSIDAEQAVLGGLMLSKAKDLYEVLDILKIDDLFNNDHKLVFKTIVDLDKDNIGIDIITVSEKLNNNHKREENWLSYIGQIAKNSPSVANITHYAKIIKEQSILRSLYYFAFDAKNIISDNTDDPSNIFDIIDQKMLSLHEYHFSNKSNFVSFSQFAPYVLNAIGERAESNANLRGVSTGYHEIDALINGLQTGSLNVIAARPSVGKTSFAMNIAENIAMESDKPVLVFSLEMTVENIIERIFASRCKIDSSKIMSGSLSENELMKISQCYLPGMVNLMIKSGGTTIHELRRDARKEARKNNGLKAIVIDYLQLMKTSGRSENRTLEIAEISRSLKEMAVDLNVPVIVLSQLNRSIETRVDKRPLLSDLRDSGAIEQDADLIMFIHRDKDSIDPLNLQRAEIIIGKNRNGPVGTVTLNFIKEFTKFESLKHVAF